MVEIILTFWFILVSFVVYMGVHQVWYSLHWFTKLLLCIFWLGYPIDWLFGMTVLTIYFSELPDPTEATISQRCKKHKDDSKLAAFIWGEIRKIDPQHLGE